MTASVRLRIQRGLVLVCVVLGIVSGAQAGPISVQVAGVVVYSDFPTIEIDSLFTALYTYDDTLVPDVDPGLTAAWYEPIAVSAAFADGSSAGADDGWILVRNYVSLDAYAMGFHDLEIGEGTRTGALVGYSVEGWMVCRIDPTATAWDSLALPDPEIVLERLLEDQSRLMCRDEHGYMKIIDLRITDLSVVPAPVPWCSGPSVWAAAIACCVAGRCSRDLAIRRQGRRAREFVPSRKRIP